MKTIQQNSKGIIAKPHARQQSFCTIPKPHGMAVMLPNLQSTHGNHFMQRFLNETVIQRKCTCGGVCRHCQSESAHQERNIIQHILQHKDSGQPLESGVQALMESRFGEDFSEVRLHNDKHVARTAEQLNALAYTVGRDIFFGSGHYRPQTDEGNRLLTHELTHVIQQSGGATTHELRVGEVADNFEHAAEQTSRQVTTKTLENDTALSVKHTAPTLQRAPIPGSAPPTDLEPSPAGALGASMIGSLTIDGFALGKADMTEEHKKRLAEQAATINRLLKQYPNSFISIAGHTDAVGTEERNIELGQKRADAVLAELKANGVTADIMRASSLGESSLLIKTGKPEPRNRRVEIFFTARSFFKPSLTLTPPTILVVPIPGIGQQKGPEPVFPPGRPGLPPPVPEIKIPQREWLKDALERDPLLRKLPDWARDKVIDGLKDADELVAEKVIDALPFDDKEKAAMKAVIKSILRMLKGKRFQAPTPPPYELPSSIAPLFPKAPGEKIFQLPPIRF